MSQSNTSKLFFALVVLAIAAIIGFNFSQRSQQTAQAPANSFERAQQQAQEAVSTATEAAKLQAEQAAKDAQAAADSMNEKMKEMTAEQQGQLAPAAGTPAPVGQPNQ